MPHTITTTPALIYLLSGSLLLSSCGTNFSGYVRSKTTSISGWQAPASRQIPLYRLGQEHWVAMDQNNYKAKAPLFFNILNSDEHQVYFLMGMDEFDLRRSRQVFVKLPPGCSRPPAHAELEQLLKKSPKSMDAAKFMALSPQHLGGPRWQPAALQKRPDLQLCSLPAKPGELGWSFPQTAPVAQQPGGFEWYRKNTPPQPLQFLVVNSLFVVDVGTTAAGSVAGVAVACAAILVGTPYHYVKYNFFNKKKSSAVPDKSKQQESQVTQQAKSPSKTTAESATSKH